MREDIGHGYEGKGEDDEKDRCKKEDYSEKNDCEEDRRKEDYSEKGHGKEGGKEDDKENGDQGIMLQHRKNDYEIAKRSKQGGHLPSLAF